MKGLWELFLVLLAADGAVVAYALARRILTWREVWHQVYLILTVQWSRAFREARKYDRRWRDR